MVSQSAGPTIRARYVALSLGAGTGDAGLSPVDTVLDVDHGKITHAGIVMRPASAGDL